MTLTEDRLSAISLYDCNNDHHVCVTSFIACDVNVTGSASLPIKIIFSRGERSGHESWIFSNLPVKFQC